MTILSAQTIRLLSDPTTHVSPMIAPFCERTTDETGATYGLSACGYDVRLDQDVELSSDYVYHFVNGTSVGSPRPLSGGDLSGCLSEIGPRTFALASTMEEFCMPDHVVGMVHDKSTWARRGLAVQNTVIEPGWRGFLTLEISLHATGSHVLPRGTAIAQVVFHRLDRATEQPYEGKYQDQERGPQVAR